MLDSKAAYPPDSSFSRRLHEQEEAKQVVAKYVVDRFVTDKTIAW